MTSPAKRRQVVAEVQESFAVSERRVCRAIEQPRSSQRYVAQLPDRDQSLIEQVVRLAEKYGRYGYRRITALLKAEGWPVNHKRVERIWRSEGLKVPQKQPKRGRSWLNDGSCVRLRPEHANHVWSYDFVMAATDDGKPFRMLNVIDEFTCECLAIQVARSLKTGDVEACLTELFCSRGVPEYIRSDNGSEFTAKSIRKWLNELGAKTVYIEPHSPWENNYIERFNGKLRDELLNGEIFYTLQEAKILIEKWRREYNQVRPHSALGYRPPAPRSVVIPSLTASPLPRVPQTLT
jgi:transposase InsO family protein